MDTAKWVSSVATYLLRNGKDIVHMSLTKLKIATKSAIVCMWVSSVLVVYLYYSEMFLLL